MIKRLAWLSFLLTCSGMIFGAQPPASASEGDVFALQAQVHAGNRTAMRKLLSLETDGAVAEFADIIMGGSIRNHPDAFLEEVARTSKSQCEPCLNALLGNLGDGFVDRFAEQVVELAKRREALRSVKSFQLQPLRDKCIILLDKKIGQIQSLIKQGIAVQP